MRGGDKSRSSMQQQRPEQHEQLLLSLQLLALFVGTKMSTNDSAMEGNPAGKLTTATLSSQIHPSIHLREQQQQKSNTSIIINHVRSNSSNSLLQSMEKGTTPSVTATTSTVRQLAKLLPRLVCLGNHHSTPSDSAVSQSHNNEPVQSQRYSES
jgi:hypothetical protein